MLVDIKLDDIHDLRTYQGSGTFSELVDAASQEDDIILAINGDYWNYKHYERLVVRNGEILTDPTYNSRRDYCAIYNSGIMRTYS